MFRLSIAILVVAGAVGCRAAQPCVPDAEQIECRCGDGTYGYLRCTAAGNFMDPTMPTNQEACDCIIGLSPDGSATLDAATE
jgi:hypothetical protein